MSIPSKVGVVIAARLGSSRLPGKAVRPLMGQPMLAFLIRRLQQNKSGIPCILATTQEPENRALCDIAHELGCPSFAGATDDLVSRYYQCAIEYDCDYIVRVTADCPFLDGATLDDFLQRAFTIEQPFDLVTTKTQYPQGLDFELFPTTLLKQINQADDISTFQREHLTLYLYDNIHRYNIIKMSPPKDWPTADGTYTIDTPTDYDRAQMLVQAFQSFRFDVPSLLRKAAECKHDIPNPV